MNFNLFYGNSVYCLEILFYKILNDLKIKVNLSSYLRRDVQIHYLVYPWLMLLQREWHLTLFGTEHIDLFGINVWLEPLGYSRGMTLILINANLLWRKIN